MNSYSHPTILPPPAHVEPMREAFATRPAPGTQDVAVLLAAQERPTVMLPRKMQDAA